MMRLFNAIYNDSINICLMISIVLLLRKYFKKKSYKYVMRLWLLVIIRLFLIFDIYIPIYMPVTMNVIDHKVNALFTTTILDTKYTIMFIISIFLYVIWIIGILVISIKTFKEYKLFNKIVKKSVNIEKNIWVNNDLNTSFVLDFERPKIYLPLNASNEDQNIMLMHERIHIERKDHIIKTVMNVLCILYWMNPMVWIAYTFICKDIECACDEKVIQGMGKEEKKNYAQTLLRYSVSDNYEQFVCPFSQNELKERLTNIMSNKEIYISSKGILAFSIMLLMMFTIQFKSLDPVEQIYNYFDTRFIDGGHYFDDISFAQVEEIKLTSSNDNERCYSVSYFTYDQWFHVSNSPLNHGRNGINFWFEKENGVWKLKEVGNG